MFVCLLAYLLAWRTCIVVSLLWGVSDRPNIINMRLLACLRVFANAWLLDCVLGWRVCVVVLSLREYVLVCVFAHALVDLLASYRYACA